jgi:hypothetical protein
VFVGQLLQTRSELGVGATLCCWPMGHCETAIQVELWPDDRLNSPIGQIVQTRSVLEVGAIVSSKPAAQLETGMHVEFCPAASLKLTPTEQD